MYGNEKEGEGTCYVGQGIKEEPEVIAKDDKEEMKKVGSKIKYIKHGYGTYEFYPPR